MRLSDAMAVGRVTISEWVRGELRGCALGMAANAAGIEKDYTVLANNWTWLNGSIGACPFCDLKTLTERLCTGSVIAHVFDIHVYSGSLTLDQLIDWVRSIEPAEVEQLAEQPIEVVVSQA